MKRSAAFSFPMLQLGGRWSCYSKNVMLEYMSKRMCHAESRESLCQGKQVQFRLSVIHGPKSVIIFLVLCPQSLLIIPMSASIVRKYSKLLSRLSSNEILLVYFIGRRFLFGFGKNKCENMV